MQRQHGYDEAPAATGTQRDHTALEALVVENHELERLEELLDQFNIFEAIGAVRQELRHSDFLAFLLNPQQPHGLGDTFLRRFLQRTLRMFTSSEAPISPIDLDIWSLEETLILREWQNIDILVLDDSHDLAILIENKIGTREHSNQLQRYYATVQAHYPSWRIVAIYLTPEGDAPSDSRYVPVSYALICAVLEQFVESRASVLGADVHTIITHYTLMLRRHIVGNSEIAELCQRIYQKHQRALDLIFEYRPDRQAELREVIERVIHEDSNVEPDTSTKSYVRFALQEWDQSAALCSSTGWTGSGRLLLFEFYFRGNDLRLKLTIGPGTQSTRQLLLDMAVAHRPPFSLHSRALHQKWDMIYDRQMVKDALSLELDLDDVESQIRNRWAEFVEGDLQIIRTEVKAQSELWH